MKQDISIREGDALEFECDVLILKYAQKLYGVDKAAFERISSTQPEVAAGLPSIGGYLLVKTKRVIPASQILFVGTKSLYDFDYDDIRGFAKRALEICSVETPNAQRVALTIHGVGFGLDEAEALYAQIVGLNEAIAEGSFPSELKSIVIVERNHRRFERLARALQDMSSPGGDAPLVGLEPAAQLQDVDAGGNKIEFEGARRGASEIRRPGAKPSIFVAMPFASEMDDTFFYGIQRPIEQVGYLCERADLASFTGNVVEWVKNKINSAKLIIAELTGGNPNVYLEVGFAWGIGKPSVLVIKKDAELKFNVRGQRCLIYNSIRDLEKKLYEELCSLTAR